MDDTTTITPEKEPAFGSIEWQNFWLNQPAYVIVTVLQIIGEYLSKTKASAEKAEAENARLTKMVDWLADKVGDAYGKPCDKDLAFTNGECPMGHIFGDDCCIQNCKYTCWVSEADRRAVDDESEVKG